MKAFLLAAGRGERFLPVTERIPKPLFPFLNVPLARAHLARLFREGVREAGVNLHHLGGQIERDLRQSAAELPQLTFFPEDPILGTAGALKNAAGWLGSEDFLVVNSDAALDFDSRGLTQAHAASGRSATLLVVENREPRRYTPLQAEGDRIARFGVDCSRPLLYTGVCILSPRLLPRIPEGETSLVTHVWEPMLARGEEIGYVLHQGPFADLGRPSDFLRASLEALARGGPFHAGAGLFSRERRVLSKIPLAGFRVERSVLGETRIGSDTDISESVVWDGVAIGEGSRIERCLIAGGIVPAGARHADVLLWGSRGAIAAPYRFEPTVHGFHAASPRR